MAKILNTSINTNQINGRSFYVKDLEDKILLFKPNDILEVLQETADNLFAMYSTEIKILESDDSKPTKTSKKDKQENEESEDSKPAKNK